MRGTSGCGRISHTQRTHLPGEPFTMTRPVIHPSTLKGVAAALALVAGSVASMQARADVVYSGTTSIAIPVSTAGIYLNVVTGATGTSSSATPGWDLNLWGSGSLFAWGNTGGGVVTGLGASTSAADNLALGTLVNASLGTSLSPGGLQTETGATAFLLNSTNNYIGFSFLNEATGATNYGWMRLSIGTAFNDPARAIIGYAYDNTGAGIGVGAVTAVPEPASAVLALAGLAGLGLWRARRRG